ncbi:hypothetical protein OIC43_08895 [Streptomyces sp. NBC_00825]|uniref:hypothetical protein n=1 Tax=unclassified Streptomyces TaxID=2593676 RepID=UPI002ED0056A|nr:hypothetical protein OG832_34805 [Streptomyces sp. NBC_00826]WTH89158.1 hypothetical protein OIC43_08895 [Streptomyces sp. NBC_00825]WTH97882.1 hypothetical protein OHA23_08880 [Streptomyces sp. NBC_00822]
MRFGEDDLGQGAGPGALVQEIGVVAHVGGNCTGVTALFQGDLLEVVQSEGGGVIVGLAEQLR